MQAVSLSRQISVMVVVVMVGVPTAAVTVAAASVGRDVYTRGVRHIEELKLLRAFSQHVLDAHVVRLTQRCMPGSPQRRKGGCTVAS